MRATALLGAAVAWAAQAEAQRIDPPPLRAADSVEVVAGRAYAAGSLHRTLLGEDYRDLWTAPIRVPVLDLDDFSGGLTLTERGGRKQTRSLRFLDPEGREFIFRSVDKDPLLARTPDLEDTYAGWLVRDQTSALFPAAAVTLPPLLQAAGVIHVVPRLAVMPNDPRLGEHRAEFAGMLGMIEERPDEGDDDQFVIAGSRLIIGTTRLRERLMEGPTDRVDSRAMLRARLVDGLINDRDRHWDQWRWARFDAGDTRYWRPVPEDRDHAYVDFDGVLPTLSRMAAPHMVGFGTDFSSPDDLSYNAFPMDRQLLADLPWAAWDSAVVELQAALTDEVIAEAMSLMPDAYRARVGDRLASRLRARRDGLREFAADWYAWLSTEVDVHATDESELARADLGQDGSLLVRLFEVDDGDTAPEPFFERRFVPDETREVRIFLHGGDDRAVVGGTARGSAIRVRVVGGEGDDVLSDSTSGARSVVAFHDAHGGADRFQVRRGTSVDRRPFTPPAEADPVSGATYLDFGGGPGMSAGVGYGGTRGLEVSVTRSWTRRGFRAVPYASRIEATAGYSVKLNAIGLGLEGDWRLPNSPWGRSLLARATQLEPFRFFGFGNATPPRPNEDPYLVERDLLLVRPALDVHLPGDGRISFGPAAQYSWLRPRSGSAELLDPATERWTAQLGLWTEAMIDRRDRPALPRSGLLARLGGSGYPAVLGDGRPFWRVHSSLATYLSAPGPRGPTLALRGGGARVMGDFPVHEAAFAGGWETLRGHDTDRFAGDAALWGAAEARVFIARPNVFVRGDLGGIAFVDAGRVYLDGESPGGWHRGAGGGLYFLFDLNGLPISGSLLYARGETDKVRIQFGAPF